MLGDRELARAAREDLGADGVLVTSVEYYDPVFPPRLALETRLVSSGDVPEILWDDAFAAGENYFPEGMPAVRWYDPAGRGLEGRIREKLDELRQRNAEAGKKKT